MSGITDIKILLQKMTPTLDHIEYVFCSINDEKQLQEIYSLSPQGTFRETEGMTVILTKTQAEQAELAFEGVYNKITLEVYSSLEAVGLTAAISTALTRGNISANVIAGFYHDHIFVPSNQATDALTILQKLS